MTKKVTSLEQALQDHTKIVEKAAASYRALHEAQKVHNANRDAEHESAERIAKLLQDQIQPSLISIPDEYKPVSIDVDLGDDRARRRIRKLLKDSK